MRACLLVFVCSLVGGLHAQTDPRLFTPYQGPPAAAPAPTSSTPAPPQQVHTTAPVDSGMVTYHQSPKIAALMQDYATHRQPLHGFRVQIFLGDRDKGEEVRRSFLVHHPDVPAYLSYLNPIFRVRVGDLRTKLEGDKLRDALKSEYPGLYVVPDEIELPRLPGDK